LNNLDNEVFLVDESNKVGIKEINFTKTKNNIQEINLCEIDITLNNNNYQHLEFKNIKQY